ncbi:hypothetical protein H0H81_000940, partial [Sphagnurus paluster]
MPQSPSFDYRKVTVIYVLGGPGAGSLIIAMLYPISHHNTRQGHTMRQARRGVRILPSLRYATNTDPPCLLKPKLKLAGDLLRAEQLREGSPFGSLIQTCIREGTIVPMEATIKLLDNAMKAAMAEQTPGEGWQNGCGRFLIDGFPRKMDQAIKFDET